MEEQKNKIIKILIGVSGVGKTTWSSKFIKDNPNWIRVNRDSIRAQLVGDMSGYYERTDLNKLEKRVTEIQEENIKYFLDHGYNILTDNTHLDSHIIDQLINKFNHLADIEIQWFDYSINGLKYNDKGFLNECKHRVFDRDSHIGIVRHDRGDYTSYMDKQYHKFLNLKKHLTWTIKPKIDSKIIQHQGDPCIIVDIDGTLALYGDKNSYDRDFENDVLNIPVHKVINDYYWSKPQARKVIFFSGRSSRHEQVTRDWLNKQLDFPYELYMRKQGDFRRDSEIKLELFNEHINNKYSVDFVIDDRLQVLEELWWKIGVFTINVNQGNIRF